MQRNGLIDLLVDLPPTMNVVRRFIAVSRSLLISCHPSRLRFGDAGDLIFPRATTNHRGSTLPPLPPPPRHPDRSRLFGGGVEGPPLSSRRAHARPLPHSCHPSRLRFGDAGDL